MKLDEDHALELRKTELHVYAYIQANDPVCRHICANDLERAFGVASRIFSQLTNQGILALDTDNGEQTIDTHQVICKKRYKANGKLLPLGKNQVWFWDYAKKKHQFIESQLLTKTQHWARFARLLQGFIASGEEVWCVNNFKIVWKRLGPRGKKVFVNPPFQVVKAPTAPQPQAPPPVSQEIAPGLRDEDFADPKSN